MLYPESNSPDFVSLQKAAYKALEGTTGESSSYGVIHFLESTHLDDLVSEPMISGSITSAPVSRDHTTGESSLSYDVSGAFIHDLRLPHGIPDTVRDGPNRSLSLIDTNPAVCFTNGLIGLQDRTWYPDPEVPTWFNLIMALGSNADITFKVVDGNPKETMNKFFDRLCEHHRKYELYSSGDDISIVHQAGLEYIHCQSRYGIYNRGWNFFFWPPEFNDRWVTGTKARSNQHVPLVMQNYNLGFNPNRKFFSEPGKLLRNTINRGDWLAELAKDIRRTATNPGRKTDWESYRSREPEDPTISFAHATIVMACLFVADYYAQKLDYQPTFVTDTLEELGVSRHFNHNQAESVRSSLAVAQAGLYKPDSEARYNVYYPNVRYKHLVDLAEGLAPWLAMPLEQYVKLGNTKGRDLYTLATIIRPKTNS